MRSREELVEMVRQKFAGQLGAMSAIDRQLAGGRLPRALRRFLGHELALGERDTARAIEVTWRRLRKKYRARGRRPKLAELMKCRVAEPEVSLGGFFDKPTVLKATT